LGPRSKIRRALTCAAKTPATCEELTAGFALEGLLAAAQSVTRLVRKAASKATRAWAACLKRVFEVDPVQCESCGGEMKLVAMIVEDDGIERILKHLGQPTNFPKIARPRSPPPLPFGVESREDSQEDPRSDDDRQGLAGGSRLGSACVSGSLAFFVLSMIHVRPCRIQRRPRASLEKTSSRRALIYREDGLSYRPKGEPGN
jgi:hypothetical protein